MENLTEKSNEGGRKKLYKNLNKHEDMRRRRTDLSVELRKQKRDDELMKRRNVDDASDSEDSNVQNSPRPAGPRLSPKDLMKVLMANPDMEETRTAMEGIRRLLSRNKNPPVDEVIDAGLVEILVQALSVNDVKIQFESAWALTNIASGNSSQTQKVISAGVIDPLIKLCRSEQSNLAEQALWALANIAGDGAQPRDLILHAGFLDVLGELVDRVDIFPVEYGRTLAWTFSNLCRHKNPHPPVDMLKCLAPGIVKLLQSKDRNTVQDACWAMSYFTDGPDSHIEVAKDAGVFPPILNLLTSEHESTVAPALRVVGNFATASDDLTQVVVDSGLLRQNIPPLMRCPNKAIVKECCWLVSNVIAGNSNQIQAVIDAQLVPLILNALKTGDFRTQYEASWAIGNLAQGGNGAQLMNLLLFDGLQVICDAMKIASSSDIVMNMLDTLLQLLSAVQESYPDKLLQMVELIEECGGLDTLEALQNHQCEELYVKAYQLIDTYFTSDLEENETETPAEQGNLDFE